MPHAHDFPAAGGVINGKLYIVGGYPPASYLDVYDPATDSWTTRTQLSIGRWQAAGVVIGGELYVFGGEGDSPLDAYVDDPTSDSWSIITQIPTQRNLPSAVAVNGSAFLIGGAGPVSPGVPISVVDKVIPP